MRKSSYSSTGNIHTTDPLITLYISMTDVTHSGLRADVSRDLATLMLGYFQPAYIVKLMICLRCIVPLFKIEMDQLRFQRLSELAAR